VESAPRLDWPGVALLSVGLGALLLAIAEGETVGWSSAEITGLFALAAVVLAVWVRQQLRASAPLVELRLLRHPAVLTGDGCALVLGVAMYMYLSGVTTFVQIPDGSGYGFGASVVVAGLCLVPFSITSLAASRALPWLGRTLGQRAVLPAGCLVVAAAGVFFALFHTALWHAFVMLGIVGLGLGTTFAAIPGLVVGAVPEHETGSAMGFYQVVRYIGFSVGSALAAALLASRTPAGSVLPEESGYTLLLWVAVVVCVLAAALAWALPGRPGPRPRANDEPAVLERGLTRV
ncbi:MAG: MFS transporter, partial [Solirubrobacterales bacterium]|nr:MFS transporter [Solirubrobacterales bacterium]